MSFVEDQDPGPAVGEDVVELRNRQAGVQRHQHRPGQRYAVMGLEQQAVVEGQDGDPVSRLHAQGVQQAGVPVNTFVELPVGPLAIAVDDGPAVGEQHGAALQEAERRQGFHGRGRGVDHADILLSRRGSAERPAAIRVEATGTTPDGR